MLSLIPRIRPLGHTPDITDLFQPIAHLHHAISYHPRIQSKRSFHRVLCLRARVEAQNEVVALVIFRALLAGWFGEQEGTPVADASDYTARAEDDVACGSRDSE